MLAGYYSVLYPRIGCLQAQEHEVIPTTVQQETFTPLVVSFFFPRLPFFLRLFSFLLSVNKQRATNPAV